MARRKKKLPTDPVTAKIESLSHEGRGVARVNGKTVFVAGALAGETVSFVYDNCRSKFDEGHVIEVLEASAERVEPPCKHAALCGGCSLQHMNTDAQIAHKQAIMLEHFQNQAGIQPDEILSPLTGPLLGYRRKARLGVRYVRKKERVLVGFREKGASFLADLESCEVLHPSVGHHLMDLSALIGSLSSYDQIAQIEVAVDDTHTAMVFRNLVEVTGEDREKLIAYAKQWNVDVFLQPKGPDSIQLLYPETSDLCYSVEEGLSVHFRPTDFTQVNSEINRKMVARAIEFLALDKSDRVLELFCGLGNFTLPIARRVNQITAVEGDKTLIDRAWENARHNGFENIDYHVANLMEDMAGASWLKQDYNKVLLDPPRSGAIEILPDVIRLRPEIIVYVSCNPATLARDTEQLVNNGYRLAKAGVMDMFPHTAHVESIAVFNKVS